MQLCARYCSCAPEVNRPTHTTCRRNVSQARVRRKEMRLTKADALESFCPGVSNQTLNLRYLGVWDSEVLAAA